MNEPTLRPATLDDAALASELMTAAYPELPEDPVLTRYRWEHPRAGWSNGRFIAEVQGTPIAFVEWSHGPWEQSPEHNCYVGVLLDRARLAPDLLSSLWTRVASAAEADGARILEAYAVEDEREVLEALRLLGYEHDRTEKVWELDLAAHGKRLLEEARLARAKATEATVELTTLAKWTEPDSLRKLHGLFEATRLDIPSTYPVLPETYENFVERINSPDRARDRIWVAVSGGDPVAASYLRFPPVRGKVWTGYTCSHPEHRGRGLARAIKLQTLAQAIELGVPTVLTDNDSQNAPMLHINEQLGYDRRPGFVSLLKRVDR
ncbi:MAG: GNAT family N-acetyltransferase [Chloroflexi bacterium]|nr:MAG: GNAT family N-acetyltransferase [Chloroflexota bacterium]